MDLNFQVKKKDGLVLVRRAPGSDSIYDFVSKLSSAIQTRTLPPKIEKAIVMFRRESNLLYIDHDQQKNAVKAVVKSQSHPDELEYAIFLNQDGHFFCTTQNLHPCGGLRGQVCKHIILSLIATVKAGIMSGDELIELVKATESNKPQLDKNEATQIFVKYKQAIDGQVDWRPVEVLPEDFMAF